MRSHSNNSTILPPYLCFNSPLLIFIFHFILDMSEIYDHLSATPHEISFLLIKWKRANKGRLRALQAPTNDLFTSSLTHFLALSSMRSQRSESLKMRIIALSTQGIAQVLRSVIRNVSSISSRKWRPMVDWLTKFFAIWSKDSLLQPFCVCCVWYPSKFLLCAFVRISDLFKYNEEIWLWTRKLPGAHRNMKISIYSFNMVQHNGSHRIEFARITSQFPFMRYKITSTSHFMFGRKLCYENSQIATARPKTMAKNLNLVLDWYWFYIKYLI